MVQVLRLPGGFWMLVGRDIGEREEFRADHRPGADLGAWR